MVVNLQRYYQTANIAYNHIAHSCRLQQNARRLSKFQRRSVIIVYQQLRMSLLIKCSETGSQLGSDDMRWNNGSNLMISKFASNKQRFARRMFGSSQNMTGSYYFTDHGTSEGDISDHDPTDEVVRKYVLALEAEKAKNKLLLSQYNTLTSSLQGSERIRKDLQEEKQYLLTEIRRLDANTRSLQQQKLKMVNQWSDLLLQSSSFKGTIQVQQEKLEIFTRENKKLIDEINFQKQFAADIRNENSQLRQHIKNIKILLQTTFEEILSSTDNLRSQIIEKVNVMREDINDLRKDINSFEINDKNTLQMHDQLINQNSKLESEIYNLKREMTIDQVNLSENKQLQLHELHYREVIEELHKTIRHNQQEISSLLEQIVGLKQKNLEMQQKIQNGNLVQVLRPHLHTNSSYLTKIIKESHREITEIKQIHQIKQDEVCRLKSHLESEIFNSNQKSQEIEKLNVLLRHEHQKLITNTQEGIDHFKTERQKYQFKIEQLQASHKTLKSEIAERDRIIMTYVNKKIR